MRAADADWTAQQKTYFKQVKRKLNYSRKLRRQILGDLAAAIEDIWVDLSLTCLPDGTLL